MTLDDATILVVEDGDEYFSNLRHFVVGPVYLQAHDAVAALAICRSQRPDVMCLDLRFDRIPYERLVGLDDTLLHDLGEARARRVLQDNQGLFILDHLNAQGFGDIPVVLATDLTHEPARAQRLRHRYPRLHWLEDGASPGAMREALQRALRER